MQFGQDTRMVSEVVSAARKAAAEGRSGKLSPLLQILDLLLGGRGGGGGCSDCGKYYPAMSVDFTSAKSKLGSKTGDYPVQPLNPSL